jgi:hypothetical protein
MFLHATAPGAFWRVSKPISFPFPLQRGVGEPWNTQLVHSQMPPRTLMHNLDRCSGELNRFAQGCGDTNKLAYGYLLDPSWTSGRLFTSMLCQPPYYRAVINIPV